MTFSETIFLFFLALIIFGPKKLPEIARQIGKALNEFRRASNEFKAQIEQEISNLEVEKHHTILPPSPAPEGTASRTLEAEASATLAAPGTEPVVAEPVPVATEAVAPTDASGTSSEAPTSEPLTSAASAPEAPDPEATAKDLTSRTSQESHV